MNYRTLTDEELERWTYSQPDDKEAAAEVLRRLPLRMQHRDVELDEAEAEIEQLKNDLAAAEDRVEELEAASA